MTGTCKFCGQVRETFVPEEIEETQENLDRLATEQCDCEKAEKEREKRQAAEKGKSTLKKNALQVAGSGGRSRGTGESDKQWSTGRGNTQSTGKHHGQGECEQQGQHCGKQNHDNSGKA